MYIDESPVSLDVRAKPIIEDKFWIVEHAGERIATLRCDSTGKLKLSGADVQEFSSKQELIDIFGSNFFQEQVQVKVSVSENTALGFPTSVEPFQIHQNETLNIPVFSKNQTSHVKFAAGYYAVKFNNGWVPSFCPKLSTLESNEFKGPFRTEIESRLALSHAKSS